MYSVLMLYLRDPCLTQSHEGFPYKLWSCTRRPMAHFGVWSMQGALLLHTQHGLFPSPPFLHWTAVAPPSKSVVYVSTYGLSPVLVLVTWNQVVLVSNFVLYESCFGYSRSFVFSREFKNQLVNSYQKTCYNFVWDCTESRPIWGKLNS